MTEVRATAVRAPLDGQLQGYLDHLTIERGVAANTLTSYRRDLRRYAELLAEDPDLELRPTFLFFKGPANGLFAEGAAELRRGGVDEAGGAQALGAAGVAAHELRRIEAERFDRARPFLVVVLVEDLVSAHKVGQVTTCIPLFGVQTHPAHFYFLLICAYT